MKSKSKQLCENVENLFNQAKFKEIAKILTDEVLEKEKNANLYAWRAFTNYKLYMDISSIISLSKKAIDIDPYCYKGYYAKALAWESIKEYDKAIEDFSKVIEIEPDSALAYLNRGLSLFNIKEKFKAKADFNKAIFYFNKSIKSNSNESITYIYRGNAYYYGGNYSEAIKDYKKTIALDPTSLLAYYNKGLACYASKNYEDAIADYNHIIIHNPRYTDDIYIHRGNAYNANKDYPNAIADYSKAIKLNPYNGNAYYSRGLAKKDNKDKLTDIKKDFDRYLELVTDDNEIWTKYAKYYVEDLKERISDKKLSNIVDIVTKIKDVLRINDECITHYTSLSVLKKLILKDSKFRISEGNFMNDPSEGKDFYKFIDYKPYTSCDENSKLERCSHKPFIGSFVTPDRCDDLNMWRFYGKENGVEANGCAINICIQDFIDAIKDYLLNEKKKARQNDESDLDIYKVAYFDDRSTSFYIPKSDKSDELTELIKMLINVVKTYKRKDSPTLTRYLNSIAFLFKSDAYKNENEVRLIVKGIEFDIKYDMNTCPPRVYIELGSIKKNIKKITFGPKVNRVNEWASAFHYSYEEEAPEIFISHQPYK